MAILEMRFKGLCMFRLKEPQEAGDPASCKEVNVLLINGLKAPQGKPIDDCRGLGKSKLHRHRPWLSFTLSDWHVDPSYLHLLEPLPSHGGPPHVRVDLAGRHLRVTQSPSSVRIGQNFNANVASLEQALGNPSSVNLKPDCLSGPFGPGAQQSVVARIDLFGGQLDAGKAAKKKLFGLLPLPTILWRFSEAPGSGPIVHSQPLTEQVFHELDLGNNAVVKLLDGSSGNTVLELQMRKKRPVLTIENLPTSLQPPKPDRAPHFRWYYHLVKPCPPTQAYPWSPHGADQEGSNAFCPPTKTTGS